MIIPWIWFKSLKEDDTYKRIKFSITHMMTKTYLFILIYRYNLNKVCLAYEAYQTLLAQQTEEEGVSNFSQVLETHRLELGVLDNILQLVVEELQDT